MPQHERQEQRRDRNRRRNTNSESPDHSIDFDQSIRDMMMAAAIAAVPSTAAVRDQRHHLPFLTDVHQPSSVLDIVNQALEVVSSSNIDGLGSVHASAESVPVSEVLGNALLTCTEPSSSSSSSSIAEEDETESGETSDGLGDE